MAWGGLVGSDYGNGGGSGAPVRRCARLELTKLKPWAWLDAVGCWGDGRGIAVMEKWLDKSVAGNDGGGERRCYYGRCERQRRAGNAKWGHG